jgi:hypothetical protein
MDHAGGCPRRRAGPSDPANRRHRIGSWTTRQAGGPCGCFLPRRRAPVGAFPSHRARCYAHSVEQCFPKPFSLDAGAHRQLESVIAFLGPPSPKNLPQSLCSASSRASIVPTGTAKARGLAQNGQQSWLTSVQRCYEALGFLGALRRYAGGNPWRLPEESRLFLAAR